MRLIFAVDSVDGGYTVCVGDDGRKVYLSSAEYPELERTDVFSAEVCEKSGEVTLCDLILMPEEKERRLAEGRERRRRLFERGKNH